jgi:hypothetical protein
MFLVDPTGLSSRGPAGGSILAKTHLPGRANPCCGHCPEPQAAWQSPDSTASVAETEFLWQPPERKRRVSELTNQCTCILWPVRSAGTVSFPARHPNRAARRNGRILSRVSRNHQPPNRDARSGTRYCSAQPLVMEGEDGLHAGFGAPSTFLPDSALASGKHGLLRSSFR